MLTLILELYGLYLNIPDDNFTKKETLSKRILGL